MPFSSARSVVARLLCPMGATRTVRRGPARGMRYVVAPGMGLTYWLGTEAAAPRHFARWVRPGMTVADVGANKGQTALLLARLVGPAGRVVSVEPAPAEYAYLERNVALNALEARVRTVPVAAADRRGELAFSYPPGLPTQGKLQDVEQTYVHASASSFPVPTAPLDELLADEPRLDVLKIDVEGAATLALRGAQALIERHAPAVFLELHGPEEQAGVRDELLARGYVAETLAGERVPDPTAGWSSPLWCYRP